MYKYTSTPEQHATKDYQWMYAGNNRWFSQPLKARKLAQHAQNVYSLLNRLEIIGLCYLYMCKIDSVCTVVHIRLLFSALKATVFKQEEAYTTCRHKFQKQTLIINPLLYVGLDWRQAWKPPVTKEAGCHSLGFAQ